jgi:hypothetical protein
MSTEFDLSAKKCIELMSKLIGENKVNARLDLSTHTIYCLEIDNRKVMLEKIMELSKHHVNSLKCNILKASLLRNDFTIDIPLLSELQEKQLNDKVDNSFNFQRVYNNNNNNISDVKNFLYDDNELLLKSQSNDKEVICEAAVNDENFMDVVGGKDAIVGGNMFK